MEVTEQAMPPLSLWLLTAPGRARILDGTLRNFAQSDCPPPRVFTDPGGPPVPPLQCLVRAFHDMLTAAVAATTTPWLLCCEDDIAVSHHLLHNLSAWPPLRTGRLCTFASLYNPSLPCAPGTRPARTWLRTDPRYFMGAQALVIARPFARQVLEKWDTVAGGQCRRLAALHARHYPRAPLYVHRPSLVQHTATSSGWGGPLHTALDFDADWREESGQ